LLAGVAPEGPAEKAGLRRGDLIVEADGRTIENLYDYTFALEAMRIGEPVEIQILRDGERIELRVVPASRD
jgi:S1-C subfamily serine protease